MAATYGTYDLRLHYNHHLSVGLSFGIGLLLFFTATMLTFHILNSDPPGTIVCRFPRNPIDDKSIMLDRLGPRNPGTPKRPREPGETKIGTPVAVADSLVPNGTTIPKQDDPSWDRGTVDPDSIRKGTIIVGPGAGGDEDPDPDIFRVVEVWPTVVRSITPSYPEVARLSQLEGKVNVKALIGKDGRVRKAFVLSSTAEIFNQPSLDAINGFVFTPAIQGNGPVPVWISMPFNFRFR